MKPALLVIDVQNGCFRSSPDTVPPLAEAVMNINAAAGLFREKGFPVLWVRHVDEEHGMVPGAEDFQILDELDRAESDPFINKRYGNAFNRTDLVHKLRKLEVDTVVVSGYCAEYCVLATYMGAEDNDLTPLVLKGTLISHSRDNIRFVEDINDLVTFGALKQLLS